MSINILKSKLGIRYYGDSWSHYIFSKTKNDLIDEISKCGMIAGGSILACHKPDLMEILTNVDIFIDSKENFDKVLALIKSKYTVNKYCYNKTTLFVHTNKEIIYKLTLCENVDTVIDNFDFDNVKCGYYNCQMITRPEFLASLDGDTNVCDFSTSLERVTATTYKGFNIVDKWYVDKVSTCVDHTKFMINVEYNDNLYNLLKPLTAIKKNITKLAIVEDEIVIRQFNEQEYIKTFTIFFIDFTVKTQNSDSVVVEYKTNYLTNILEKNDYVLNTTINRKLDYDIIYRAYVKLSGNKNNVICTIINITEEIVDKTPVKYNIIDGVLCNVDNEPFIRELKYNYEFDKKHTIVEFEHNAFFDRFKNLTVPHIHVYDVTKMQYNNPPFGCDAFKCKFMFTTSFTYDEDMCDIVGTVKPVKVKH